MAMPLPPPPGTPRPPVHIINPTAPHTHTAILLHGLGSSGPELAQDLLVEGKLSSGATLPSLFPSWRWVLPSSRQLWSHTFREYIPAWFNVPSLSHPRARLHRQAPGLSESAAYIRELLLDEADRLPDEGGLVLGGISQGAAVAMTALLAVAAPRPMAFFGASTWLPFSDDVERLITGTPRKWHVPEGVEDEGMSRREADEFVAGLLGPLRTTLADPDKVGPFTRTSIFLGHGVDDAIVDVELGRRAQHVLLSVGFDVVWKEYEGAELEGHWFKEPQELDDIAEFLQEAVDD